MQNFNRLAKREVRQSMPPHAWIAGRFIEKDWQLAIFLRLAVTRTARANESCQPGRTGSAFCLLQNFVLEGRIFSMNAVGLVQLLQFFVKAFDGTE